ncbi:MAG: glycosyltransferase family 8 protein [Methanobrevibacter sp.]|jgi:lipopolysaccharide biosynthesis glycosyltransferase|nr:glycosyltransferase family 8 protein [Candidatus Methanovirga meridionalis]
MVLNFLFSANDSYSMQLCVCIVSLEENNPNSNKRIYIINNGISEVNFERILSLEDKYNNLSLVILDGSCIDSFFNDLISTTTNPLRLEMFGRAFVNSLIDDDNVDKLLYLDCDTIVMNDVSSLFNLDLGDNYLGAVLDRISNILAVDLTSSDSYFNSGVLLINLKKWREDNLEEKILKEAKIQAGNPYFNDQAVLNWVLQGKVKILPLEYNYHPHFEKDFIFYRVVNDGNFYSMKEFNQIKVPAIVHFYGLCKPWFMNSTLSFKDNFSYYKSISPFSNVHLGMDVRLESVSFRVLSFFKRFLKNPKLLPLSKYYFIHKFKKSKCRIHKH